MTTKTQEEAKATLTAAESVVTSLITKAGAQQHSCDALRFTQAALNAANALSVMATAPARVA